MAGEKRVQMLKSVLRKHGGEWRWLEATKMKLVVDRLDFCFQLWNVTNLIELAGGKTGHEADFW